MLGYIEAERSINHYAPLVNRRSRYVRKCTYDCLFRSNMSLTIRFQFNYLLSFEDFRTALVANRFILHLYFSLLIYKHNKIK